MRNYLHLKDILIYPADPTTLEVEVFGKRSLSFLLERLRECDINVISMRNKSNRLEELFLELTRPGATPMKQTLAWIAFKTIVIRESKRTFRVWRQSFLPAIVTSILYFVIFGRVIGAAGRNDGWFFLICNISRQA